MSHKVSRRILWMSIVAASFTTLSAADGLTLINPKDVARGAITPGDAPGFPITITQPGSYRLTANLTVPDLNTTAVEITADDVTLDLNGFSIMGPNVCTPDPTTCQSGPGLGVHAGSLQFGIVPPNRVRVMNGTVRGMGLHGVRLMGEGTFVEKILAYSNGGPGIVVGDGSVIDSFSSLNGGSGIIGAILRGNNATRNKTLGIFVRGPGGVAIGNSAKVNGGYGIDVMCASTVADNSAVGNAEGGIRLQGSAACAVSNNSQ
jgi:parallel beta-helix repeat protein